MIGVFDSATSRAAVYTRSLPPSPIPKVDVGAFLGCGLASVRPADTPRRAFNPKVAGSIPAGPTTKRLVSGSYGYDDPMDGTS